MNIAVIGGGASGIVAAIVAARNGSNVTIFEHTGRIGKKILATGNGKCNLTNTKQSEFCYRSDNEEFPMSILQQFTMQETVRFFGELGIYTKNRNGYLYPHSEQASAVLDVLRLELRRLSITVLCESVIKTVRKDNKFTILTELKTYQFDKVILATGSKAAPNTGSDGSGYSYARNFGHTIIKPLPSLVQLKSDFSYLSHLAGVRCEAEVTLMSDGVSVIKERGEVQWVNYGISGIPIFQVSRFAAKELDNKKNVTIYVDFLPDFSKELLHKMLMERKIHSMDKNMEEFLVGLFHKKIGIVLLKMAGIKPDAPVKDSKDKDWDYLINQIKGLSIRIKDTNTFENAQVCAGGVDTREIDTTMQSKLVTGLYFAGEIVDVDGCCGGYNLQWAWSSGYVAGFNASKG